MGKQSLPKFEILEEEKPKEFVLMNINDYDKTPIHFLTFAFRDGWSVQVNREEGVAIFYK